MKLEKDALLLPKGFFAEGFSAGIKKSGLDMAIIYSIEPAAVAATFTRNKVRAACIDRNKKIINHNRSVRGIMINSGNANACTGNQGEMDNEKIASLAADLLNDTPDNILTASTGVIGVPLPIKKIEAAVKKISLPPSSFENGFKNASIAIMTTDTAPKTASIRFSMDNREITLTGIAKGSGMIHPDMATMLAFITTDLAITPSLLQSILKETVDETFNMISVDGDTSTNDMVVILANGKAENSILEKDSKDYPLFKKALLMLNRHLAKSIAADGEGATKLLEVEVNGAKSIYDARKIARSVISSNLVKTAFFGMDPNWGRIISAMGYSGADFNPGGVSIYFQGAPGYSCLMHNGKPHHFDADTVKGILKEQNITITINLTDGESYATAWGCDLSYDYVKINAEYTT